MRWALVALVCAPAVADAYPHFQLSTGAKRCNQCHIAPAGGGLLNGWGREQAGDEISLGGDGALLHGAWEPPDMLSLGADVRAAFLVNDGGGDAAETAVFPMQVDLYGALRVGPITASVALGMRGQARDDEGQEPLSFLVSREHYVMWRPKPDGPYARAGRFFAPYGLRPVEHPLWIRKYGGFGLFEETYGLSGGLVRDDWEVHVTGWIPSPVGGELSPVGDGETTAGVAAYGEWRRKAPDGVPRWLRMDFSAGLGGRIAGDDEQARHGLVYTVKIWWPALRVLTSAQIELVHQSLPGAPDRWYSIEHYSSLIRPVRGVWVGLHAERYDGREAMGAQLSVFPWAHVEGVVFARTTSTGGELLMLQLHYYL
jgi:hypothetical protein